MRAVGAVLVALVCSGCATLFGLPARVPECAGELISSEALGPDFVARERFTLQRGAATVRLDLVVQKRDAALVLVGFDPLGAKLFTVVQRGMATEVEEAPRVILAVPALNVLRDVHRARFGAATDARVTTEGDTTRIDNPRCASETELVRVSVRRLP